MHKQFDRVTLSYGAHPLKHNIRNNMTNHNVKFNLLYSGYLVVGTSVNMQPNSVLSQVH